MSEGKAPPRRHHYVPAFLLQGFTLSGRRDEYLWVHDLEQKKSWKAKPDKTAHERDYDRIDLVDVDPYLVEEVLSKIESEAAATISGMQKIGSLPSGEDFQQLIYFVTLLALRTPSFRELYEQNMGYMRKTELQLATSDRKRFEEFINEQVGKGLVLPADFTYQKFRDLVCDDNAYYIGVPRTESVRMILQLLPDLFEIFLARSWSLLLAAPKEGHFICADMPVSITPTKPDFKPQFLGFGQRDTELRVPLSCSMALVGAFDAPSVTREVGVEIIRYVNQRTRGFAKRFIYSPNCRIPDLLTYPL